MITKAFFSSKSSFLFCLEDLKQQVDKYFDSYDFLLFSIHPKYPHYNVTSNIKKIFKTNNFVAFNTTNVFIDDDIKDVGVGLFVIKFERKGKIDVVSFEKCSEDTLKQIANYFNNNQDKVHIVISTREETCDFIEKLSEYITYPVSNIAGGVIKGSKENNFVFTENKFFSRGIAILSFSNVNWQIGMSSGFIPYGIMYKITKAKNKRIYSVDDGKNFAYIFKQLLDGIEHPDIRYTWYTPIYVLNKNKGHLSSVRTIKNITDKYVEFFSNVNEGEYFKLSFATKDELLKENKKVAIKMWNEMREVDAIFNFSCLARQYVLEDKQKEEIEIYTNIFDAHLFGFFTAGEIAPDSNYQKLLFYNETSIPVILKEV